MTNKLDLLCFLRYKGRIIYNTRYQETRGSAASRGGGAANGDQGHHPSSSSSGSRRSSRYRSSGGGGASELRTAGGRGHHTPGKNNQAFFPPFLHLPHERRSSVSDCGILLHRSLSRAVYFLVVLSPQSPATAASDSRGCGGWQQPRSIVRFIQVPQTSPSLLRQREHQL